MATRLPTEPSHNRFNGSLMLEGSCWKVLRMYAYVLRRRAQALKLNKKITLNKVIGAIISEFVLTHHDRILNEYKTLKLGPFSEKLDSISDFPQIPDIPGGRSDRRPDPSDPLARKPGSVRGAAGEGP